MDIATRFHPRARASSYRDVEGNAMPDDSGGESETNLIRRKFQRTTTDPGSEPTFRKPTLPASATRPPAGVLAGVSTLEHQRRRSTLRENQRVPSGPRAFPSSPGKSQRMDSTQSSITTAAAVTESTNTATNAVGAGWRSTDRAFRRDNAETLFHPRGHTRVDSFGRKPQREGSDWSTEDFMAQQQNNVWSTRDDFMDSTPATSSGRLGQSFEFLPDVNFDDFQTSIKNYDGTSPLLSDFPAVDGGRILPKEDSSKPVGVEQQQRKNEREGLSRTQSLRQRLASGRQVSGGKQQKDVQAASVAQLPATTSTSTFSSRRQSSVVSTAAANTIGPAPAAAKPPRKSVGPGLLTNLVKGGSSTSSQQQQPSSIDSSTLKPALSRNPSLTNNKNNRRITIQPSASAGAESLPRISTLTATTQARQNKVKSLQPPPRDETQQTTPSKPSSKSTTTQRAHTPSSSGNRRQSTVASGRASGLGARTISPTDARRLKRMSVAPPMPDMPKSAQTPTPGEEIPNPMAMPEMPRLTQPSPSLIPRKNSTPNSARDHGLGGVLGGVSPEGRQGCPTTYPPANGGVSLNSKPSYSSLFSNSGLNGSSSRLPTPKPRSINTNSNQQSSSSLGQYSDSEQGELVPPVPAIPKAYESPKDLESAHPFFSSTSASSLKSESSFSGERFVDAPSLPTPRFLPTPRTSLDVPAETPRKRSGEMTRPSHRRNNTLTNDSNHNITPTAPPIPPSTAPPPRAQPDPNGRKNNNLQPLRLPPLNLMPLNTRAFHQNNAGPRPSLEVDHRGGGDFDFATPEPKRNATKTPSTPMTASKATFFSRVARGDDGGGKALRSSSSHYALRDVMGMDEQGNILGKGFFWDEGSNNSSDVETNGGFSGHGNGVPVPSIQQGWGKQQRGITPFASGSLPKSSGEFIRERVLRGRPSGEFSSGPEDEFSLGAYEQLNLQVGKPRTRAQTNGTVGSAKSALGVEVGFGEDSSPVVAAEAPVEGGKKTEKEGGGGGLRRKLSLGWRRSSSKAENKSSPRGEGEGGRSRLQKRSGGGHASMDKEMPPPKLPASATWSGMDVPSLPASTRPSLDAGLHHVRRKSQVPTSVSSVSLALEGNDQLQPVSTNGIGGAKTRSLHTEQPTPVMSNTAAQTSRTSSWGNLSSTLRGKSSAGVGGRHKVSASSTGAATTSTKDKDDLAADEEMHRLSRKRKDVDSAARETEDLRKRAVARSPVSAEHVLHDRGLAGGQGLNVFERGEIVDFEKEGIFFTGTKGARKIVGSLTPSPTEASDATKNAAAGGNNNFGYDDERGDYNIVLGDHLAYRYEVVDVLGKGSFGQVVRCVDHREGCVVAVKIIRNKKRFHQQALVEVGILGRLREWDPDGANATLSITSSFYFRSHLCIVTPCLSINLYELIRAHNFVGFSLPLIRRFARQLLACLVLLQSKHIIHCDLKPENILLCEARKADVRVIDFGSSCREEEKVYTYIQSRFYRSPEVILGSSYGLGIDMWSLGCILAELWTGYPLFPGENEQEQLACIMEIFGPPDRHLVERCTRKKLFFDSVGKPRVTVSSKGRRRRPSSKTLQQALKTEDEAFVDFVARCLRWDPERRLKPSEAVSHPFVLNVGMNQRQGIPDEARRAARVRSTAAVPAQGIPSPVKRGAVNAAVATTPARERTRPLPETPQTALRNGTAPMNNLIHGSPTKATAANRRHSAIVNAGAAAVAESKRASNGALLGTVPGPVQHQQPQQRGISGPSLAQIAARESMGLAGGGAQGSAAAAAAGSRWRT